MNKRSKITAKYQKANTKTYLIRINKNTEQDIIKRLESVKSKNGYIKKLIREDAFINNLEKGVDN